MTKYKSTKIQKDKTEKYKNTKMMLQTPDFATKWQNTKSTKNTQVLAISTKRLKMQKTKKYKKG